ncbi:hypothetical protein ES703_85689 [subsurface metagenome]
MPSLNGAVSFVKVQCVAGVVGYYLHLHVAGFNYKLFQIDTAVSEGRFCFGLRCAESRTKADIVVRNSHTPSATTGGSLYHHGVAHFVCELQRFRFFFNSTVRARDNRDPCFVCQFAGLDFVTEQSHCLNRRADKCYPAVLAYLGKVYILSQEAITRMNCLDICNLGGTYDTRDI